VVRYSPRIAFCLIVANSAQLTGKDEEQGYREARLTIALLLLASADEMIE